MKMLAEDAAVDITTNIQNDIDMPSLDQFPSAGKLVRRRHIYSSVASSTTVHCMPARPDLS